MKGYASWELMGMALADPIPIDLCHRGTWYRFMAGPYDLRPTNLIGVNLDDRSKAQCDYALKIPDFGVPKKRELKKAIRFVLRHARTRRVYIGCYGGLGRTGTVLGCIIRILVPAVDPVSLTRALYTPQAIETKKQEQFVRQYADWGLRARLRLGIF